jgi:hypothetical protein
MYAEGAAGCVSEFLMYKLLYNTVHARAGAGKALLTTMKAGLAYLQAHPPSPPTSTSSSQAATCESGGDGGKGMGLGEGHKGGVGAAAGVEGIRWALRARAAALSYDLPAFFRAYGAVPALGRALLDALVPSVRWAGLNTVVKGYGPTPVPVRLLARMLGFIAPPGAVTVTSGPSSAPTMAAGANGAEGGQWGGL